MRTISICICTVDRQDLLKRALESIYASKELPYEIIVSEDGKMLDQTRNLCQAFPLVRLIEGSGSQLCANRNRVIHAATGEYISLMDDDAMVSKDFLKVAKQLLVDASPRIIYTGDINEDDRKIKPTNPTFWGHFGKEPEGNLRTINLNCNIFPRNCFNDAQFDEAIEYGCEDMDLCAHLIALGYSIAYVPELWNFHCPPGRSGANLAATNSHREVARYYTSFKRYVMWEKNPTKSLAYFVLAPVHRMMRCLKLRRFHLLGQSIFEYVTAIRKFVTTVREYRLKESRRSR